jgi:hypothetical protein
MDVECAKLLVGGEANQARGVLLEDDQLGEFSKETLDILLRSKPQSDPLEPNTILEYLADCFGFDDDMLATRGSDFKCLESLLSDRGSCFKCTNDFPIFEIQKDSEGILTCPSCMAAHDVAPRLDSLEAPLEDGNTCSQCGEHMPGIGSVAKVMCTSCRGKMV